MNEYIHKGDLLNELNRVINELDFYNIDLGFGIGEAIEKIKTFPIVTKADIIKEFCNNVSQKYSKVSDISFDEFCLTPLADCLAEAIVEMESGND